jgi:TonB family protein
VAAPSEAALPAPPEEPPAEVQTIVVAPDAVPTETAPVVIEAPDPPLNPVPLSRLTRAPTFAQLVKPVDPLDAPMPQGGARVVVRIVLDAAGEVRDVEIVRSAGPAFDAAVIAAIRRSRFTPGFIDDTPVATVYNRTFRFVPR